MLNGVLQKRVQPLDLLNRIVSLWKNHDGDSRVVKRLEELADGNEAMLSLGGILLIFDVPVRILA